MDPLASLAFSKTGDMIENNFYMDKQKRLQSELMAESNMASAYNQSAAPARYVSGLRSAGLPVSLAFGGSFQPAAASSPLPVSSHPVEWSGVMASLAQSDLLEAQRAKIDAETTSLEKRNQRESDEDFTIDSSLREWLRSRSESDDPNAEFYGALADSPELFSRGTLQAIKDFDSTLTSLDDSQLKQLSNAFYKAVFGNQLNDDIAKIVADVPKREQLAFFADLTKVYTEVSKLLIDSDLDKAKIQETFANIDKIVSESNSTYHKDFAAMVHNKDYLSAGISLLGSTIQAFGAGAGATAGASLAGKVGIASKAAKSDWKGAPFPYSSNSRSTPHPEGWSRY